MRYKDNVWVIEYNGFGGVYFVKDVVSGQMIMTWKTRDMARKFCRILNQKCNGYKVRRLVPEVNFCDNWR